MSSPTIASFAQLGLSDSVLRAVYEVGYETPSRIQAESIVPLMEGRDILGQAQTGTGKTAAFALPILSRLDLSLMRPQALVLTPTRELAIQVAEAFQTYARYLPGFHVLPIYGGQSYSLQLRPLRRGVHAVVGTPGRVLDHLRRGTLSTEHLSTIVLDEADEMLRMGFIDDVEYVLQNAPEDKQLALFSATMPGTIKRIAQRYTNNAVEVRIEATTATVSTVTQWYWQIHGMHKLDALTRILETEDFDAMVVFVRTKTATAELAERLEARGFSASALNGDMNQATREQTIERLKAGRLDILVATDVAARGLDVDRISHVVNYDIPYDTEAYVHRIGRTARAGRGGTAILFVAPRERRMLRAIEKAIRQPITPMPIPSEGEVENKRTERFKAKIAEVLASQNLEPFERLVASFQTEHGVEPEQLAAALAYMAQGDRKVQSGRKGERKAERQANQQGDTKSKAPRHDGAAAEVRQQRPALDRRHDQDKPPRREARPERDGPLRERPAEPERVDRSVREARHQSPEHQSAEQRRAQHQSDARPPREPAPRLQEAAPSRDDVDFVVYRLEVGSTHGAQKKNIVGAIANEAGLNSQFIGVVHIHEDHTTVELPDGMPKSVFKHLKRVWVCGQQLNLAPLTPGGGPDDSPRRNDDEKRVGRERAPKEKRASKSHDKSKGKPKRKEKVASADG
ncbi:MAG: DEAD/DEAH box helicase [Chromatiales bacterium]|nr:DEAD/DEAH box helicase [Chromatiales bacterium]